MGKTIERKGSLRACDQEVHGVPSHKPTMALLSSQPRTTASKVEVRWSSVAPCAMSRSKQP